MVSDNLNLLRLLQLADSALPIGSASHSFGLETLVNDGAVAPENLQSFFETFLQESGALEAVYCREAWILARTGFERTRWNGLNHRLSATRLARESRKASVTLGRRFLQLASAIQQFPFDPPLDDDVHLCTAFGFAAGTFRIPARDAVLGYLHQTLAGLLAASQRIMPLGQTVAARILWDLKPLIVSVVEESALRTIDDVACFQPMLDLSSMRHPGLHTRLFVS